KLRLSGHLPSSQSCPAVKPTTSHGRRQRRSAITWLPCLASYGQETHLRFQGRGVSPTEGSCRFPLIVLQQTPQSFLATHNSVIPARPSIRQGEQEPVLLALVIALL